MLPWRLPRLPQTPLSSLLSLLVLQSQRCQFFYAFARPSRPRQRPPVLAAPGFGQRGLAHSALSTDQAAAPPFLKKTRLAPIGRWLWLKKPDQNTTLISGNMDLFNFEPHPGGAAFRNPDTAVKTLAS